MVVGVGFSYLLKGAGMLGLVSPYGNRQCLLEYQPNLAGLVVAGPLKCNTISSLTTRK